MTTRHEWNKQNKTNTTRTSPYWRHCQNGLSFHGACWNPLIREYKWRKRRICFRRHSLMLYEYSKLKIFNAGVRLWSMLSSTCLHPVLWFSGNMKDTGFRIERLRVRVHGLGSNFLPRLSPDICSGWTQSMSNPSGEKKYRGHVRVLKGCAW